MLKIIHLIKRKHPGLEEGQVEAFQKRWRQGHGPIAARLPGLRRYVQSHALVQGYRKGELLFDGISEFWFANKADLDAAKSSPAWDEMVADLHGFVDTGRCIEMPIELHVIKDNPAPPGAVKNIEFVNQRPGMDRAEFRRYWREVHGPIAARIPVLHRYEQNHLALTEYDRPSPPPYDGLAITWFASTADMKAGTRTEEYRLTRADEPHFLPDGHLPIIITREYEIAPSAE
ncbi:EthD domain-containing protein [Oceanibaculum pacificum]|uniref:EthD domain-containing protein n=1 Tax=Oceanibaculum pacificum TaxID=580166 RepID=A0A154VX44_9PROT|nr:EthD domain-containing protein [Oceanibaculum pacificum]KZD05837.1 hypothetical protein AUP43_02700 [Oceanibaculum pacificum]